MLEQKFGLLLNLAAESSQGPCVTKQWLNFLKTTWDNSRNLFLEKYKVGLSTSGRRRAEEQGCFVEGLPPNSNCWVTCT